METMAGEASFVEFSTRSAFNDVPSYNEAQAGYARSLYTIDSISGKVNLEASRPDCRRTLVVRRMRLARLRVRACRRSRARRSAGNSRHPGQLADAEANQAADVA